jgi:hypothetical protein
MIEFYVDFALLTASRNNWRVGEKSHPSINLWRKLQIPIANPVAPR